MNTSMYPKINSKQSIPLIIINDNVKSSTMKHYESSEIFPLLKQAVMIILAISLMTDLCDEHAEPKKLSISSLWINVTF